MNLTKLKKLADLKQKHEEAAENFEKTWAQKKKEIIEQARERFKDFFTNTDFQVEELEEKIEANYDSINITLTDSKTKPDIKAGPYYLTFEIIIDMDEPEDIIYKIPVDKCESKPVLKKRFRVRQYYSEDLAEKIEKIDQSISEVEEMTTNFTEVELGFALVKDTTSSKNILETKKVILDYDDFNEVLIDIFE